MRTSAVAVDDLLDDREADAGVFEILAGVQTLEYAEQFTRELQAPRIDQSAGRWKCPPGPPRRNLRPGPGSRHATIRLHGPCAAKYRARFTQTHMRGVTKLGTLRA